jgi:hypothetical protein
MRFPVRRRFGAIADNGPAIAGPNSEVPYMSDAGLASGAEELGYQPWAPGSGVEETQGSPYLDLPGVAAELQRPLDPGIDTPTYVNPYRTVMYAVSGIDTAIPMRALSGNPKRTYLLVQNLGPGNLFLGIGVDPVAGGTNVLNLVSTQVYEQIGGGFFIPAGVIAGLPNGLTVPMSFCSAEYVSLLTDTAGTGAMILEGTYSPAWAASLARPG